MKVNIDISVWEFFIRGDKEAFATLFKTYYTVFHAYGLKISGNKELTEDCLQEFFVYLFQNRKNLNKVTSINSYLFISFRRAVFKAIEKQRKRGYNTIEVDVIVGFKLSPEELLIKKTSTTERNSLLVKIINSLSEREREVIYLKYYNELKTPEIAEVMNISYQSVQNTLQKAFAKFRKKKLQNAISEILNK